MRSSCVACIRSAAGKGRINHIRRAALDRRIFDFRYSTLGGIHAKSSLSFFFTFSLSNRTLVEVNIIRHDMVRHMCSPCLDMRGTFLIYIPSAAELTPSFAICDAGGFGDTIYTGVDSVVATLSCQGYSDNSFVV